MKCYYIYILECKDNSFYTGLTSNLEKRVNSHKIGLGSKFTKNKIPVKLVYWKKFKNKFDAAKREKEIKGYRREKKTILIDKFKKSLH